MRLHASWRDWLARRRETMACRDAVELMTAYLEDALDVRSRGRFEMHLAECAACTACLDQMRATIAVLGRVEPDLLDAGVRAELVSLYRAFQAR